MSWAEAKKINSDPMTPLNEGGVKIVKSIQRGSFTSNQKGTEKTVAISTVDASKSHVTFWYDNTATENGTSYSNYKAPKLKSMNDSSFTIISGDYYASSSGDYSYQTQTIYYEIIEFY